MTHRCFPSDREENPEMKAWIIKYEPEIFPDDLYDRALSLVDGESAIKIRKFFRREDACRSLIGRLLPRLMLKEHGAAPNDIEFGVTEARKPYIAAPPMQLPLAFNVSHDSGLIAMAYGITAYVSPILSLGIDVMRVRIPGRDTLTSFIETMEDQLTYLERQTLSSVSHAEALNRFFWIWTVKEAYTKALGLGLGFDFRRVEFDTTTSTVRVDGSIPRGWIFRKFVIELKDERYQGVVAENINEETEAIVYSEIEPLPWLVSQDAVSFVERCVREL